VAQKSKPPPIFQKIVLKIANEIRFIRKVWIKHFVQYDFIIYIDFTHIAASNTTDDVTN